MKFITRINIPETMEDCETLRESLQKFLPTINIPMPYTYCTITLVSIPSVKGRFIYFTFLFESTNPSYKITCAPFGITLRKILLGANDAPETPLLSLPNTAPLKILFEDGMLRRIKDLHVIAVEGYTVPPLLISN